MTLHIHYFNEIVDIPDDTTSLHLHLADGFPINIEEIARLPTGLRAFRLNRVYPAALVALAQRCPQLEALELSTHGLPADALTPLAGLKHLRALGFVQGSSKLPDLSALGQLTSLTADSVTMAALRRQLPALPALDTLRLSVSSLTHADLAAIAALPALRDLSFVGRLDRSRNALTALKDALTLQRLQATALIEELSADEIATLTALPALARVNVSVSTPAGVHALAPLHDKIERLGLTLWGSGPFGDRIFAALADAAPHTRALDISAAANPKNCAYSQIGIGRLGELKRLEWLETGHLDKTLSAEHLAWLTQLPALQQLGLTARALSAKIGDTLGGCAALHTLVLRHSKLSDASLKKLTGLQLKRLTLLDAPTTEKGVVELAKIKPLEQLCLHNIKGAVSDVGLRALATLPALRSLQLTSGKAAHTFTTLAPLAAMPALQSLMIPVGHVPDRFAGLRGAPALQQVTAESVTTLDAASAAALKTIPTLRQLGPIRDGRALMDHSVHVSSTYSPPKELGDTLDAIC